MALSLVEDFGRTAEHAPRSARSASGETLGLTGSEMRWELELALPGVAVGLLGRSPRSESWERARACVRLCSMRKRSLHASQSHVDIQTTRRLVRPISIGQITRAVGGARARTRNSTLNRQWDPHAPSPPKVGASQAMRKEINLQIDPSALGSRACPLPTSPSTGVGSGECVVLQLVHPTAALRAVRCPASCMRLCPVSCRLLQGLRVWAQIRRGRR